MNEMRTIVLASASPRRRVMFEEMGIPFEVIPADIDEAMIPGEQPEDYAIRAALDKGVSVANRLLDTGRRPWIVSADTIVLSGQQVLTKPVDDDDARRMLSMLSGQTHRVITGWAVGRGTDDWTTAAATTDVTFHRLSHGEIDGYIATQEGRDKAGAYAIQQMGAFLVDRIDGNYFNVVGLPISHVVRALMDKGALPGFLGT